MIDFLIESNRIESIHLPPSESEQQAFMLFLLLRNISVQDVCDLQSVFAPCKPLRDRAGMDVIVGGHTPPRGCEEMTRYLQQVLDDMSINSPWKTHCEFETLHPFMDGNGRTGRMLWAWHMRHTGKDPFRLGFLHSFYYQTLAQSDGRLATQKNN